MEGIRKQQIKENSFGAGWTSHLYELPRLYWSFYVFDPVGIRRPSYRRPLDVQRTHDAHWEVIFVKC